MIEEFDIRFVGESTFLRIWPAFMLAFGLYLATRGALGVGLFLALVGCAVAVVLPWRYLVLDDGLFLQFAFGKRRFLPRDQLVVRVNRTGGVAHRVGRRLGYPLTDRLVERRTPFLRAVLHEHGYTVA